MEVQWRLKFEWRFFFIMHKANPLLPSYINGTTICLLWTLKNSLVNIGKDPNKPNLLIYNWRYNIAMIIN